MADFLIIGGGIAGLALATMLGRQGARVEVIERRGAADFDSAERSINLALSARGLAAISSLGADEALRGDLIAMFDRCVHVAGADPERQPYDLIGRRPIFSVRRAALWRSLRDAALESGAHIEWDARCVEVHLDERRVLAQRSDGTTVQMGYAALVGADGVRSAVRQALEGRGLVHTKRGRLEHGYLELQIPASAAIGLHFHSLHVWPRDERLLVALPNPDKSFTGTFFLPWHDFHGDKQEDAARARTALLRQVFHDFAAATSPGLLEALCRRRLMSLDVVECDRWSDGRSAVLLGDAAHGMAPYLGQGANCALEDCTVLSSLLASNPSIAAAIREFDHSRRPDAVAIAEMSVENRHELSVDVAAGDHRLRREVERRLRAQFPDRFMPLYEMIAFTTIPYAKARALHRGYARIVERLVRGKNAPEDVDLAAASELLAALEQSVESSLEPA